MRVSTTTASIVAVTLLASLALAGGIAAAEEPVDEYDLVYTGDDNGTVTAYHAAGGSIEWEVTDLGDSESGNIENVEVSADGEAVYIGGTTTPLTALDPSTGDVLWESQDVSSLDDNTVTSAEMLKKIAIDEENDRLFVAGDEGDVSIVDTNDGSEIDTLYPAGTDGYITTILYDDHREYLYFHNDGQVSADAEDFGAFDVSSEQLVWDMEEGGYPVGLSLSHDGQQLYVMKTDGATGEAPEVFAWDPETGDQLWIQDDLTLSDGLADVEASPTEDIVYSLVAGNVYAIDNTGSMVWEESYFDGQRGLDISNDGSELYVAADRTDEYPYVHSVDAQDGSENWAEQYDNGGDVYATDGLEDIGTATGVPEDDEFENITGVVRDQDGNPVGNATVAAYGILTADDIDDIDEWDDLDEALDEFGWLEWAFDVNIDEIESLAELQDEVLLQLDNPVGHLEDWLADYSDSDEMDRSIGTNGLLGSMKVDSTVDGDAIGDDVDGGYYALAHSPEAYDIGRTALIGTSIPTVGSEPDAPTLYYESGEPILATVWDPEDTSGTLSRSWPVRDAYPGNTVDEDDDYGVLVSSVIPGHGGSFGPDHETDYDLSYELEECSAGDNVPYVDDCNTHPAAKMNLPDGVYRIIPHNDGIPQPGVHFHVVVGDPLTPLETALNDELEEVVDVPDYVGELQNVTDEVVVDETARTSEDGTFSLETPPGDGRIGLHAYRGPPDVVDAIEELRAGEVDSDTFGLEDIEMTDFQAYREQFDYNGTFYIPMGTEFAQPGDGGIEPQVLRTEGLPWDDLEDYQSLQDLLQEIRLDDTVEHTTRYVTRTVTEEIPREQLEQLYDSHVTLIQTLPDAEDDYLEASSFDEVQDAEELDREELQEEIDLMQGVLFDQAEVDLPEITDDMVEVIDGELVAEVPLPDGIDPDSVYPELHWSDGTIEPIDEEYWDIEESGLIPQLSSDALVVEGYPVEEDDPAMFDLRVVGADEDGNLIDDVLPGGENPAWQGEPPDVRAAALNTKTPGVAEPVRLQFRGSSGELYSKVERVEAWSPEGNEINASFDGETARFEPVAEGDHLIRAAFIDDTGEEFVQSLTISAYEEPRSDPPTIRAENAPDGILAVVGEGLRDGEILREDASFAVTAVATEGSTPASVDVKLEKVMGSHTEQIDVHVVEGPDERSVRSTVELVIHAEGIDPDADAIWRDTPSMFGQPIDWDGGTRYGEAIDRELEESGDKVIIRTFTDDDGTGTVTIVQDPGIWPSTQHSIALLLPRPSIPFVGSIVATVVAVLSTALAWRYNKLTV